MVELQQPPPRRLIHMHSAGGATDTEHCRARSAAQRHVT